MPPICEWNGLVYRKQVIEDLYFFFLNKYAVPVNTVDIVCECFSFLILLMKKMRLVKSCNNRVFLKIKSINSLTLIYNVNVISKKMPVGLAYRRR